MFFVCLSFALVHADQEAALEPIQVQATTIDDRFEARREDPTTFSVIRGEDIDRSGAENLEQVLRSVPGMTLDSRAGVDDSVKIKLRGIEGQRYMGEDPGVAVIIDGVPVKEQQGRVNIDLDNIESIRVIRGGASYLYGEDALAGAVIITTKRGADMHGFRAEGSAGSFGFRRGLLRAGYAGDRFNTYIQGSRRESDGWHARSGYEADYLQGNLQYYIDDFSDLTFNFELSDRWRDGTGSVTGRTKAEENPRGKGDGRGSHTRNFNLDLARYSLTYSRDFREADNLLLSLYQFTDDTWNWQAPMRFDADGNSVADPELYQHRRDWEQKQRGFKGEWRISQGRLAGMLGLDLRRDSYELKEKNINDYRPSPRAQVRRAGEQTRDEHTREYTYAGYAELKARLSQRWALSLNSRFDHIDLEHKNRLKDRELNRTFNVWSWRGGATYRATPEMDLFANISTGFRTPDVEQLFAGGYEDQSRGNPDLDPESLLNLELGLRGETSWLNERPLNYELTLFQTRRTDAIQSAAGQYAAETDDDHEQRYGNIGGVRHQGLELSLDGKATEKVSWRAAYTYLHARYTDYDNFNLALGNSRGDYQGECAEVNLNDPENDYCIERHDLKGNSVPRVPEHTLNLGLDITPLDGLTLTAESHTISSWYADELNKFRISGHTIFNLLANYSFDYKSTSWRIFGRVENILDETYYNRAAAWRDNTHDGRFTWEDVTYVVNPGRSFMAGLEVRF